MRIRGAIVARSCALGALMVGLLGLGGCAQYVTPGASASLLGLAATGPGAKLTDAQLRSMTDYEIQQLLERKPAAKFPANLVVARVQASGYESWYMRKWGYRAYGSGKYSVITSRDVETEDDFKRLSDLPMVDRAGPLNRLVIPDQLESDLQIRQAAARLKADIMLLYTFETVFNVKDHEVGPFNWFTLGFLPNQEARVSCTASAILLDVRTGYLYGMAEGTATKKQMATIWSDEQAVDDSRKKAERAALDDLMNEIERTWRGVVNEYARM